MRKYLWFILALLVFFGFAAQAIIGVKLLELRSRIQRDRIMNLELSSQALEARSRRLAANRQDFRSEIRQSVIESGLLNTEQPEPLQLSLDEYAGLGAINTARILAFKPLLFLFADYETLLLLRYAFYLERNRRYTAAIQRYEQIASRSSRPIADVEAFIALHLAYCLASTGESERAIPKLVAIQQNYGGTHFARAATILLHILQDGARRSARLDRDGVSELERARQLMQMGLCAAALRSYEKHRAGLNQNSAVAIPLSPMDTYRESLCFEETGQIRRAVAGYQNVVREARDRAAALYANRRLLIVGNFYAGDQAALKEAQTAAKKMGDTEALGEITTVAREQKAPLVLEEIRNYTQAEVDPDAASGEPNDASDDSRELFAAMHAEVLEQIGPVLPPLPEKRAASTDAVSRVTVTETENNNAQFEIEATIALSREYPVPAKLLIAERTTAVSSGLTRIKNLQGAWLTARRINLTDSGKPLVRLVGSHLEVLALDEILEIAAAPIGPGQPGVLEIGLRDGRVIYGSALRSTGKKGEAQQFQFVSSAGSKTGAENIVSLRIEEIRFIRTP